MLHLDLVGENDLCMWREVCKGYRTIYTNKEFLIVAKFGTAININRSQAVCATDWGGGYAASVIFLPLPL